MLGRWPTCRFSVRVSSPFCVVFSGMISLPWRARREPQLVGTDRLHFPLKECYAFDVIVDERDAKKTVIKTKQAGFEELWDKLKKWQGDEADKKIRLYSAEPSTVANVYSELQDRLKRYGGGYHNPAVKFSDFNKTQKPDGSGQYSGLSDGYEIYSTDNSRSLVVLPSGNALVYLSSENIQNAGGFQPGGDYEAGLEGHSWFLSCLQTHALFHSGF